MLSKTRHATPNQPSTGKLRSPQSRFYAYARAPIFILLLNFRCFPCLAFFFPLPFPRLVALRDAPTVTDAVKAVAERCGAAEAAALEALGEDDAEEVDSGGEDAGAEGDEGVEDGAGIDVAAHAGPLDFTLGLGQGRGREPADAEGQR